ncbi:hypothetical protein KKI23_01675 [Patescibacteria group bacterium]|nr:hypothetical protein [Patescibacteria group bacterium]
MAKEKTSRRVAKIASKQLRSKKTSKKAKATAGSALTQYEPKRKKRRKK